MNEITPVKLDRVALNAPMGPPEAAAYLGVGIDMLNRFEKDGLVTHRLGPGPKAHRRWYRTDLDDYLAKSLKRKRKSSSRCSEIEPGQGAA